MLQVSTRHLIEAVEESIQYKAREIFGDDLGPAATKEVFGSMIGPLPHIAATTEGDGFYDTDAWEVFFEDLQDPYTAVDTVGMPELQVSFEI